jgi:hypothetical protein
MMAGNQLEIVDPAVLGAICGAASSRRVWEIVA